MTAIAAAALAWIDANPGSAAEAIVLIGAVVPGTPILMAIGAAAGIGHVSLCGVIFAAIAGAVVGGGLSYWIGHRCGEHLRTGWPFARRPGLLARGTAVFSRWGALGVATARFLPGLRAVPVVTGMFGMRPTAFYVANVTSALIWAPLHILPGTGVALLASLEVLSAVNEIASGTSIRAAARAAPIASGILLKGPPPRISPALRHYAACR